MKIDVAGAGEDCEGSFEALNKLGRSVEGLCKEAKGLEASGAALGVSDTEVDEGGKLDCGFWNKLLELLLSGWNVWEKRPELVLG